jgi:hypothetical protein
MRKLLTITGFLLVCSAISAQSEINKISIAAGPSNHGTGDFKGFALSITYDHELAN